MPLNGGKMVLNIKNPEAHDLAQKLAHVTGGTLTSVVIEALRERLDRTTRQRPSIDEILAIGKRCAQEQGRDRTPHAEMLYDERGLPR